MERHLAALPLAFTIACFSLAQWLEQEDEEIDVLANWDTDVKITQEEWEQLFAESDDESDFEWF